MRVATILKHEHSTFSGDHTVYLRNDIPSLNLALSNHSSAVCLTGPYLYDTCKER